MYIYEKQIIDKFTQLVKQPDFEKNYRVDIEWGGLDSSTDVCDVFYKGQKIFSVQKYMNVRITIKIPGEQDLSFSDTFFTSLCVWDELLDVYRKQQEPVLKQERLQQQIEQQAEQSRIKQEQDRILNKIDGFIKMANTQSK